jgi:hypothetical protein
MSCKLRRDGIGIGGILLLALGPSRNTPIPARRGNSGAFCNSCSSSTFLTGLSPKILVDRRQWAESLHVIPSANKDFLTGDSLDI